MRLAFMGTPDFAAAALAALIAADHEIACVYTQPPRPAGRGHKERRSPVHELAARHGIEVRTPKSLRDAQAQAEFAALGLDVAVVAAYGLILPGPVLEAPRHGCLNIHASLLPRWRGAAPIQHAILAGDAESGVTIMQMDAGLDTGPMLLKRAVPVTPQTTAGRLHDALAALGADLIRVALEMLARGALMPEPQDEAYATYAPKITAADGRLDWTQPAEALERRVRAMAPWPGAWFEHAGTRYKVGAAELAGGAGEPGVVLDDALTVACGSGALRLLELQRPGRAMLPADEFLRGVKLPRGTQL